MTVSANRFDFAERDGLGGVSNKFYAAVIAMAGHDLRQPLQVIFGAHDILARKIQTSAERVFLSDIRECRNTAGRYI